MKEHLQTGKDRASNKNCIEALSVEKHQTAIPVSIDLRL
jgi:hypothetical protein